MFKYGYDKNGEFYMTIYTREEGIKFWNKIWKEEFEKHNQKWKNILKKKMEKK